MAEPDQKRQQGRGEKDEDDDEIIRLLVVEEERSLDDVGRREDTFLDTVPAAVLSHIADLVPDRTTYNSIAASHKEVRELLEVKPILQWPPIQIGGGQVNHFARLLSADRQWFYQTLVTPCKLSSIND